MTLTLRIENYDLLEDGGPAHITVEGRGFQAGRGAAMDWVLPDPARHVSSHHFDVAFVQGSYWLTDVSTNGTFLQGQRYRLDGPHKLNEGDRFQVGHYIIVTHLGRAALQQPFQDNEDPWSLGPATYDPVDPVPRSGTRRLEDAADDFVAHPLPSQPALTPVTTPPLPGGAPAPLARPKNSATPEAASGPTAAAIVQAFCEGAGIPPGAHADADAEALARALGESLRVTVDEAMSMLRDRAAAKRFVKGNERTMRGASDNNPLKFLPDSEQALEALFLRRRAGYLSGADGLSEALRDIRLHQAAVFAAMQPALAKLLQNLAPEAIEAEIGSGMLGSRKGKAWDTFVNRWDEMSNSSENGLLDIFLEHFAEAYARAVSDQNR